MSRERARAFQAHTSYGNPSRHATSNTSLSLVGQSTDHSVENISSLKEEQHYMSFCRRFYPKRLTISAFQPRVQTRNNKNTGSNTSSTQSNHKSTTIRATVLKAFLDVKDVFDLLPTGSGMRLIERWFIQSQ